MSKQTLNAILKELGSDDVQIDAEGRIIIKDQAVIDRLTKAAGGLRASELADNYGCCTNGALCGKGLQNPEDLVAIQRRLGGG